MLQNPGLIMSLHGLLSASVGIRTASLGWQVNTWWLFKETWFDVFYAYNIQYINQVTINVVETILYLLDTSKILVVSVSFSKLDQLYKSSTIPCSCLDT